MSRPRTFRSYMIDRVRDPAEAAHYLSAALEAYHEDGSREALLLALRTVVEAQGGIGALSERTGLNRQHLYRALSEAGNPSWTTMASILSALGLRFVVESQPRHSGRDGPRTRDSERKPLPQGV